MKSKKILNIILNVLIVIGIVIIVNMAILKIFFVQVVINGRSMEPTLHGNDVDGYDIGYMIRPSFKKIQRFDIVAIHVDETNNWVKRIIGLPNEEVSYADGKLYINGELMAEPFSKIEDDDLNIETIKLSSNQYFVIGDNRLNSDRKIAEKEDIFGVNGFIYSQCGYYDMIKNQCHDRCGISIRAIK